MDSFDKSRRLQSTYVTKSAFYTATWREAFDRFFVVPKTCSLRNLFGSNMKQLILGVIVVTRPSIFWLVFMNDKNWHCHDFAAFWCPLCFWCPDKSWMSWECFKIVFEAVTPLLEKYYSFTGALDSAWLCLCGALVMPLGCVLVTSGTELAECSNRMQ